jgi:protein TonB
VNPKPTPSISLFEFMPYGAPELMEAARRYMLRAIALASGVYIVVYLLLLGFGIYMANRPQEIVSIPVVPYRELAAPPPLSSDAPPPQVAVAQAIAAPAVGVAVPVPDAEAPQDQTIASQQEIAASTPAVSTGQGDQQIVVAPPAEDELPKFDQYVYVEELPEAITKVPPLYPDLAREAGVDGTVMVQALVDKSGRVRDTRVVKSIPMLDAAAVAAVKQWVFKPALSNNRPVAVWVAVPVRFTLH